MRFFKKKNTPCPEENLCSTISSVEALIAEEQRPLVEALKDAQAQLDFFMKNRFPSNTLGETLAKIDKALEGVK